MSAKSIDEAVEKNFKFGGRKELDRNGHKERVEYYICKLCKIHVGHEYREQHYLAAHLKKSS